MPVRAPDKRHASDNSREKPANQMEEGFRGLKTYLLFYQPVHVSGNNTDPPYTCPVKIRHQIALQNGNCNVYLSRFTYLLICIFQVENRGYMYFNVTSQLWNDRLVMRRFEAN